VQLVQAKLKSVPLETSKSGNEVSPVQPYQADSNELVNLCLVVVVLRPSICDASAPTLLL